MTVAKMNLKTMIVLKLNLKMMIVLKLNLKVMIVLEMMSKKMIQNAPLALLFEMVSKLLNLLRLIEHFHFSELDQHHGTVSSYLNSVLIRCCLFRNWNIESCHDEYCCPPSWQPLAQYCVQED